MRRRFLISTSISDLLALGIALIFSGLYVFGRVFPGPAQLPAGASLFPLWGLLFGGALLGLYVSFRMWAGNVPRPSYGRGIGIVGASMAVTSVGIVLSRVYWSRPYLAATAVVWTVGALSHRVVRKHRPWTESMLIVSNEKELIEDLDAADHADILGVLAPSGVPPDLPPPPGTTVVVDLRAVLSDGMAQFVSSANIAGFETRTLSNVYEEHTGRIALVHLTEGWEIRAPLGRAQWYLPYKRVADLLTVIVTSPIWVPIGLVIALAVRVESRGPAIFKQTRIGYLDEPFTLYKFRTMVEGADAAGPKFAVKDDPRLTRVGKALRILRADEIPQLWNVIRGDVSIVGPRPEQVQFVEEFKASIPFYSLRHQVPPGITGWAQVSYGYADDEAETIEKLTYDLYYMKHMSPWTDLRIVGSSIWTVLSGFGAR